MSRKKNNFHRIQKNAKLSDGITKLRFWTGGKKIGRKPVSVKNFPRKGRFRGFQKFSEKLYITE